MVPLFNKGGGLWITTVSIAACLNIGYGYEIY